MNGVRAAYLLNPPCRLNERVERLGAADVATSFPREVVERRKPRPEFILQLKDWRPSSIFGGSLETDSSRCSSLSTSFALVFPASASARQQRGTIPESSAARAPLNVDQSNLPTDARRAEDAVERAVRRFRIGAEGGVGLDPELIMFGAHGAFGPLFRRNVQFRPGIEIGSAR